jgi:hypothetical protein
MKLNGFKYFSQADPKWASIKLGTSTINTIKNYGCLLSCVASVCTYYGKDTDPLRLNADLVRVKGYYNGSFLVYGAVTDIYPDITMDWDNFIDCSAVDAPLDKIDNILASKRPVIVKVDYDYHTSKLDDHWITIIGKTEDGSYICCDSLDGTEIFFQARYGDPKRYIFKIVVYNGPVSDPPNLEDKISDLETKIKSLNETVASLSLENNSLRNSVADKERQIGDLEEERDNARSERDTISWENDKLNVQVQELTKQIGAFKEVIIDKDIEIGALTSDLGSVQMDSIRDVSSTKLLTTLIKRLFGREGE